MKKGKFLRRNTTQYLRLGKKRKKLQKWQKPKGRDNKMRLKFKGYPKTVSIGYGTDKRIRGKIGGEIPAKVIRSINEIKNLKNNEKILIGRFGSKKKIEIAKIAKEKHIDILNLNINKLLKKFEKQPKEKNKEKKNESEK